MFKAVGGCTLTESGLPPRAKETIVVHEWRPGISSQNHNERSNVADDRESVVCKRPLLRDR